MESCRLGMADRVLAVQHLAVQVSEVDDVVVNHAERADPRCREVEQRR